MCYVCFCGISIKGYYRVLLISKDVVVNCNGSLKTFGVLIKVQLQVKGLSIHKWVTIVKDLNFTHTAVWPGLS